MGSYITGIAGGTASGKSTFCSILEEKLSARRLEVFHMDNYFKPEEDRPHIEAPVTGIVYMDDNHPLTVDLPRMREDVKKAMTGEADIILVEGLLTLSDNGLHDLIDLKLFIDCQADERIVRRIRRNREWGLSFEEITSVYLDMVRYRHDEYVEPSKWRADMIINGSRPLDMAAEMIVRKIESVLDRD